MQNSSRTAGTPISIHLRKLMSTPSWERMNPIPLTLGGVPTGVARPPIEAANEVISISAVGYRGSTASDWDLRMAARIDRAIPNIMAVVAVFEIHQEISAVTAPKASRIRLGRAATQGRERTAYANLRSSP